MRTFIKTITNSSTPREFFDSMMDCSPNPATVKLTVEGMLMPVEVKVTEIGCTDGDISFKGKAWNVTTISLENEIENVVLSGHISKDKKISQLTFHIKED